MESAEVAELVDAQDSGSCGGFLVLVRFQSSAPFNFVSVLCVQTGALFLIQPFPSNLPILRSSGTLRKRTTHGTLNQSLQNQTNVVVDRLLCSKSTEADFAYPEHAASPTICMPIHPYPAVESGVKRIRRMRRRSKLTTGIQEIPGTAMISLLR